MDQTKQIFRPAAVRHYNERRSKAVLPMFRAPRFLKPLLWLAALFLLATLLSYVTPIPTYSTGVAFNVGRGSAGAERDLHAVLFPADVRGELRAGQRVFLQSKETGLVKTFSIAEVLPGAPDPEAFLSRYDLPERTTPLPSAAAVVLVRPDPAGLPGGADESSSYPRKAHVEVGGENLLAFLFSR